MATGMQRTAAAPPDGANSMGSAAQAMLSKGAQMLQIRTEKQLMVAELRPRDPKKVAAALYAEAAEAGEDFFYSIPYKDHVEGCQNRRSCKCPSKPVEGPGVGLARAAVRLWGNDDLDVTIDQELDDCWMVRADFIDFETNFHRSDTKRVSKMKTLRGGRVVKAQDRELDVIYQQGASKVERDVVLRALPRYMIEAAFELAKMAAVSEKKPLKEQIARLMRRFNEIDVTMAQVESYLGKPFTEDGLKGGIELGGRPMTPQEVLAHLRGIVTAIRGGETEANEIFGAPEAKQATVETKPGDVTMDDLEGKPVATNAGPTASTASDAPVGNLFDDSDVSKKFSAACTALGWDNAKIVEVLRNAKGNYAAALKVAEEEANKGLNASAS